MASEVKFTKCDLLLNLAGFVLYSADIATDLWVAAVYLFEGHFIWCVLVLTVTLVSAVILQSFSWTWYKDDEERQQDHSETEGSHNQVCKCGCSWLLVIHIFQMGIPMRFIKALMLGYKAAIKQKDTHMDAIYAATDLSMLRLFEAFLETAPQLVLQTFILLVSTDRDYVKYGSVIVSCMSISWATLDYYAALKKSLPAQQTVTCGFPYVMYFFYKLLTLGSRILSITLLTMLSVAAAAYLFVLWLIMFICVTRQKTIFCKSRCQEIVYRMVVGIILVFTFFNIKGQNTQAVMALYYIFRTFETTIILLLCWLLKGSALDINYYLSISITIGLSLVIGIVCLVLYYRCFHPHVYSEAATDEDSNNSHTTSQPYRSHDEIDGFLPESSAVRLNINEISNMIHSSVPNPRGGNSRIRHCLTY
ncbi:XK-related protein 9 [Carcharodon carcharias]|uniref:XK-related protein 9 n=1 Tax=Carcharodon carcharias TaxID=13397 RepID=UPI001B7F18F9|nr:XK-related protein 9 [Carcharodon carcharias]